MGRPKPPDRARTLLREQERAARKQVKRTEKLAARLPGADADQPIDVPSASVVELRARSTSCPQCGGALDLRRDVAHASPRGILRALDMLCRRCHAPRTLWFRVLAIAPS